MKNKGDTRHKDTPTGGVKVDNAIFYYDIALTT